MVHKRSPARLLLDTSAAVHQLHGHTLQQTAVREAVTGAEVLVPVFVRMEYLRGVILNLIEMWCLTRESTTVVDAFIDWSQKVRQERKLKVILLTVPHWLGGQEDWRSKGVTLRRLATSFCG
jgi:predicted nucleic acid-binding protein